VAVKFKPKIADTLTGTLVFADNAAGGTQTVTLIGS
jgi:hypothetical protein